MLVPCVCKTYTTRGWCLSDCSVCPYSIVQIIKPMFPHFGNSSLDQFPYELQSILSIVDPNMKGLDWAFQKSGALFGSSFSQDHRILGSILRLPVNSNFQREVGMPAQLRDAGLLDSDSRGWALSSWGSTWRSRQGERDATVGASIITSIKRSHMPYRYMYTHIYI